MMEYTILRLQRRHGTDRWRAEVPIAGSETGPLVGWPVIEQYMALFGWHVSRVRPMRCHLTAQDVTFTALQVLFARVVPAHPEVEGIAWHAALPAGGIPYGN